MILETVRACSIPGILVLLASSAFAQLPQTRLYALSRSGGQAGQAFDVVITAGDDLEEIGTLRFSHPGITAELKAPDSNSFTVTIATEVPPGTYEVRCGGRFGFSNPRGFVVGDRPEIVEGPGNNTPETATTLELGSVVNGRLESASDIDWFRFEAKQGQPVVFDCWAERVDSRMNGVISIYDESGRRRLEYCQYAEGDDPVLVFNPPADGAYLLKLHDLTFRSGNEYVYRLETHAGPYLEFAFPPAGTAGTTGQFTLYGYNLPGGEQTDLRLVDVPLQKLEVEIPVPAEPDTLSVDGRVAAVSAGIDAFSYRLTSGDQQSNPVRIGIAPVPVVREEEPNDTSELAQMVTVPVEIGGQFAVREDNDVYRFEAGQGEDIFIEVIGERMGAPVDPYLIVNQVTKKEDGTEEIKRLTAQDAVASTLWQNVFETKTNDPLFRLQVPAEGLYEVVVRDRYWESRGNPKLLYRLSIRHAAPDFRLVAVPSAPNPGTTWPAGLRKGDSFPVNVLAFRKDGFTGPIRISAAELPEGFAGRDVVIGENRTQATLVIMADEEAASGWHQVKLQGTAAVQPPGQDAKTVTREARGGTVVWSTANNVPAISRITDHVAVTVIAEPAPFQVATEVHEVEVRQDRQIPVPVKLVKRQNFDEKVTLAVQDLPNNTNIEFGNGELAKGESEQTLQINVKENAVPGTYTLWLKSQGQVAYARNPERAERLAQAHEQAGQAVEAARQAAEQTTQLKNEAVARLEETGKQVEQSQAALAEQQKRVEAAKVLVQQVEPEAKQAAEGLAAAARTLQQADENLKAKDAETKAAAEQLARIEAALEQTEKGLTASKKALITAEAEVAQARAALEQDAGNQALKATVFDADQSLQNVRQQHEASDRAHTDAVRDLTGQVPAAREAQAAYDQAAQAQAVARTAQEEAAKLNEAAAKKLAEARQGATAAEQAYQAAQEELATFQAAAKAAEEARVKAEADEKAAQEAAAAAERAREAAEKAAKAAAEAAKPKNVNFTPPSTPIVLLVKPAAVKAAAAVPDNGNLKKGEKLEVKVTVTRQNDFKGPVRLSLAIPEGVTGISSDSPEIPADQAEGTITITAAEDAAEGELAGLIIRASADFHGEAVVDLPVTVNVSH